MLYRYAQYKEFEIEDGKGSLDSFSDHKEVSPWAMPAMKWAVNVGIIVGSNSLLKPRNSINRAEMATILCRYNEGYYEKSDDYFPVIPFK